MLGGAQPPVVSVAAAVICRAGSVLLSRRLPGSHLEGAWEFPGGKAAAGEEPLEALHRELEEELGLRCAKAVLFHYCEHAYPERTVRLHFYLCVGLAGEPRAREGQELRWVSGADLEGLEAPAANREVLRLLASQL